MPEQRRRPVPRQRAGRLALGRLAVRAAVVVLVAGAGGCSHDEFQDRTAEVRIGERTTTFEVDSCGLDGRTVFVVGRSSGGVVLQAVVGVEADGRTGVVESTGLTVTGGDVDVAAFGPESWERRGEAGPPPGQITSAQVRGSRIQVAGEVAGTGGGEADGAATTTTAVAPSGPESTRFSLDARCDQIDD